VWVESSSSSPVEGMTAFGATSPPRRALVKDRIHPSEPFRSRTAEDSLGHQQRFR